MKSGRDPSEISLVVVSKNHPLEAVLELYQAGCRDFGENRVQEALPKIALAPDEINWHFIGTLQTKKIPRVLGKFSCIHSVDSFYLAEEISKRSQNKTPILLQMNTSGETTKHGLTPVECQNEMDKILSLPNLDVQGFMTMAPLTEDTEIIRNCFASLREFRNQMEVEHKRSFPHLSMGMSHDYPIAIEEGATILRIGSAILRK